MLFNQTFLLAVKSVLLKILWLRAVWTKYTSKVSATKVEAYVSLPPLCCHMTRWNGNYHRPLLPVLYKIKDVPMQRRRRVLKESPINWVNVVLGNRPVSDNQYLRTTGISGLGRSCQFLARFLGMPLISWMTLFVCSLGRSG